MPDKVDEPEEAKKDIKISMRYGNLRDQKVWEAGRHVVSLALEKRACSLSQEQSTKSGIFFDCILYTHSPR